MVKVVQFSALFGRNKWYCNLHLFCFVIYKDFFQGNADAQANIGRMFYWGQGGVDRNIDEAFEMQRAAALQNHPDGLFDAGIMLLKGHGTDKNVSQSTDLAVVLKVFDDLS